MSNAALPNTRSYDTKFKLIVKLTLNGQKDHSAEQVLLAETFAKNLLGELGITR